MKLLIVGAVVLVLLGAGNADAWPWSKSRVKRAKLPKPIDSPIVRPKQDDSHKAGGGLKRHPERLQRQEWGSEMGRFTKARPSPIRTPYLFQE